MKKYLFALLIILSGKIILAKNIISPVSINTLDTVFFDLSKARISGGYVDIPVYFISDDIINSLDFELKFNEAQLTYSSLVVYKPYLSSLAHFNQSDRFLRLTSYTLTTIENNTPLMALRFSIANPCLSINLSDFSNISTFLNGEPCSYKIKGKTQFVPTTNFTSTPICQNSNVFFSDATFIYGDSISSWSWNFGNGNTSSLKNATVNYSNLGNYVVTLITSSKSGCKDTVSKTVKVNPVPVVDFSSVSDCQTGSVLFSDASSISSGTINQ